MIAAGGESLLDGLGLQLLGYNQVNWGFLNPFQNPPPLLLTMIPIVGPLLQAGYDIANGMPGWGLLNIGLALFDATGVGLIADTFARVGGRAIEALANSGKVYRLIDQSPEAMAKIYVEVKRLTQLYLENGGKPIKYIKDLVGPTGKAWGVANSTLKGIFLDTESDLGTFLHELYHAQQYIDHGVWGTVKRVGNAVRQGWEVDVEQKLWNLGFRPA
jgi:hypothetical protein